MNKLIEKIRLGDEAAFQKLIDETKSKAFYTAKGIVKNDQDAEEVVYSAYYQMYQKLDTLKNADKFNSWFSKIVVNLSLNKIKQGQNKEFVFSQFDNDEYREDYLENIEDNNMNNNPQEAALSSELSQKIACAMDELSEVQRQCLQYYYFNELSVGEIAELFDVPKSTVKTRLRLGRENLKSRLEKDNIFGLSFLPAFFNSQVTTCEMHIVASEIMKSSAVIAMSAAQGAGAAAAEAGGEATTAVISQAASTVAKGALAKKIIAGAIALGVIAGGGAAGASALVKSRNADETATAVTETTTEPETADSEYALADGAEESTSETETETETEIGNTIKSETEAAAVSQVENTTETETQTTEQATTLAAVTYSYDENVPGSVAIESGSSTYYSDIGKKRIIKRTSGGKESTALKNVKVYQMLSYNGYIYYVDESKKAVYQWNLSTGKRVKISKQKLISEGGSLTTVKCWDVYIKGDNLVYIANEKGSASASKTIYAYDLKTGKTTTVKKVSSDTGVYLTYAGVYSLTSSGKTTVRDINGTKVKSSSVVFENDKYQITLSDSNKYKIKNKSTGKTYSHSYLKKEFKSLVKSYDGWDVEESDIWADSSIEIYSLSIADDTVYGHIHVVNSTLNVYDDVTLSFELG